MLTSTASCAHPTESAHKVTGARRPDLEQIFPRSYGTSVAAKTHFSIACRASAAILMRQGNQDAAGVLLSAASRAADRSASHEAHSV